MRKKAYLFCCLLMVTTFFVTCVPAAYSKNVESTVSGKVTSIDLRKPSLTVTSDGTAAGENPKKVTVNITGASVIKKGSGVVSLADILIGQKVMVKYQTDDTNQDTATEVLVQ